MLECLPYSQAKKSDKYKRKKSRGIFIFLYRLSRIWVLRHFYFQHFFIRKQGRNSRFAHTEDFKRMYGTIVGEVFIIAVKKISRNFNISFGRIVKILAHQLFHLAAANISVFGTDDDFVRQFYYREKYYGENGKFPFFSQQEIYHHCNNGEYPKVLGKAQ